MKDFQQKYLDYINNRLSEEEMKQIRLNIKALKRAGLLEDDDNFEEDKE